MYLFPLEILFVWLGWRKGLRWRALIPIAVGKAFMILYAVLGVALTRGNVTAREDVKDYGQIIGIIVGAAALWWLSHMIRTAAAAATRIRPAEKGTVG